MRWTRVLRMAADAGKHGAHGHGSAEYGGFHAPHVDPLWGKLATGIGATMWFWIFYRAREDGPVLLGLRHPWEHGDHGDHHAEGGHHAEEHH